MSQEFDNNVLDLLKQNVFYRYEYMGTFNEELPSKENFYSLLTNKKIIDKEYEHILDVWKNLKWKQWKIITTCI